MKVIIGIDGDTILVLRELETIIHRGRIYRIVHRGRKCYLCHFEGTSDCSSYSYSIYMCDKISRVLKMGDLYIGKYEKCKVTLFSSTYILKEYNTWVNSRDDLSIHFRHNPNLYYYSDKC